MNPNTLITFLPVKALLASASAFPSLHFNPIRLILFIGWSYLCFYLVQFLQYNPLVSKNYRTLVAVGTLFTGPILLIVILVVGAVRKSLKSGRSAFEIIKEQLSEIIEKIMTSKIFTGQEDFTIQLLDSSGRSIKEIYGQGKSKGQDNRVLDLTEQIVLNALTEKASDILVDPKDNSSYTVRFRVDGILRVVEQFESQKAQAVINSIKAVSGMDIAERRRPQDGSFTAKTAHSNAAFRTATAGVLNGEKLSIRVLNHDAGSFTLTSVGFSTKQQALIREAIAKPSGMILICGPTGSGKTTTLYSMLNEIDLYTRNVVTVEDPIECMLPNASQIEVNPKADITFAKSLRSILRQDPDVICVGEIRDEETAGIALRASQTGHLVLATIHSSSNAAALVRLLDLGVQPTLMASGLSLIVSQRLLRCLCPKCKVPAQLTPSQIQQFRKSNVNYAGIYQPRGCKYCYETGFKGRTAICDFLNLDENLKTSIAHNDLFVAELRKSGEDKGKSNLYKQGLKAVVSGITSIEELKRVVG